MLNDYGKVCTVFDMITGIYSTTSCDLKNRVRYEPNSCTIVFRLSDTSYNINLLICDTIWENGPF